MLDIRRNIAYSCNRFDNMLSFASNIFAAQSFLVAKGSQSIFFSISFTNNVRLINVRPFSHVMRHCSRVKFKTLPHNIVHQLYLLTFCLNTTAKQPKRTNLPYCARTTVKKANDLVLSSIESHATRLLVRALFFSVILLVPSPYT